MNLFKNRWFLSLSTLALAACLYFFVFRETRQDVERKIRIHLQENNSDAIYPILRRSVGSIATLDDIHAWATEYENKALLNAVTATRNIQKQDLPITQGEFLQLAFFIELHRMRLSAYKMLYLDKEKSFLSHNLEYYRPQDAVFIILEGPMAKISKGKKKHVKKALLYDRAGSQIVARLEQTARMKKEVMITKKMQNKSGIFEILGFGEHQMSGNTYTTIYAKLYNLGSLFKAMETTTFTFKEKVLMAENILKGLANLHAKKIVHRDLGTKNYLVDIRQDDSDKRIVTCCIADLGRANFIRKVKKSKPQGNVSYTAPEALFRDKLCKKDYYKTDIYALGLALYWLYYGERAPWQDSKYVKDTTIPLKVRHKMLVEALTTATKENRERLKQKQSLSCSDDFEALIFNMLECDPLDRLPAKVLCKKIEQIAYGLDS